MDREGRRQGVTGALAAVAAERRDCGPDDAQPDLLSDRPEDVGAGPLDAALVGLGDALRGAPRRGRAGGGRPKGSRNKSTEAWREYFLACRRDPAFALADIYSLPVEELAARLGCDKLDALKVQIAAANAVLPYVHQRLPQAVQIQGDALPMMTIVMGASGAGEPGSRRDDGVVTIDAEIVENQGVGAGASADLDGADLDSDGQVVDDAGVSGASATDLRSAS